MGLYFAGGVLIVGAALLILSNREVSIGHAAIVAIGAVLIAMPHLTNVEVSADGLKFTTRDQGKVLADQVEGTNQQIQSLQESLEKITKTLEENAKRIAALEVHADVKPDAGAGMWKPGTYDKQFFDDLLDQNKAAKAVTTERLQDLEHFKKTFQPEARYAPLN